MGIRKTVFFVVLSVIMTIILTTNEAQAGMCGYNISTTVWDWSNGNPYTINGNSSYQTLYSEYLFTGGNAYSLYLESSNYSGSNMTVKLWKKNTYGSDTLIDSFVINIGGTVSRFYGSNTVSSGSKYYFEFSPSAIFTGEFTKVY